MFSPFQLKAFEVIENGEGNIIIQARAGSGKTFTACHGMARMKGKVCSLTFNKKNQVELAGKIAGMGLINAKASTFHSEGLFNYKNTQKGFKVNNSKVYFIAEGYTQDKELAPARTFVKNIVSLAKQSGFGVEGCPSIDDDDAWIFLASHYDISLDGDVSYETAIEIAKKVLRDSNRNLREIDFDDMIYLPLLLDMPIKKYDWVIVDEAQDTNVVRKIMAERMMGPNSRALFIGDSKQAIYGFTGAENNSMDIIKETFDCQELSLPICYRCGSNIIKEAQTIVPDIIAKDDAIEGTITSMKYEGFLDIANELELNRFDGIICRNNAPNVALAFALIRRGIGCRIEGRDIGKNLITLCKKWKRINTLDEFTLKMVEYFSKEMTKPMNKNKMQLLEDKMDTLIILIERCQSLGETSINALIKLIEDMFSDSDDKNVPNVVVLSSIHKAKGLEFKRCFILGMGQFQPSKYAIQEWQREQEDHLKYVAITRAMEELIHITDVPTRRNANTEE